MSKSDTTRSTIEPPEQSPSTGYLGVHEAMDCTDGHTHTTDSTESNPDVLEAIADEDRTERNRQKHIRGVTT